MRPHAQNAAQRTYRHLSRRPPTPFTLQYAQQRPYANVATARENATSDDTASLAIPTSSRFNDLGVQHLSSHVHPQIFKTNSPPVSPEYVGLAKSHLTRHGLLGKNTDQTPPVAFDLPAIEGASLDEHFQRLGASASEPYLSLAKNLARSNPPPRPRRWLKQSGWTKYHSDGTAEAVEAPNEEAITFDTEVMYKETSFPAMACAVSATSWYAWLSPWLLGESKSSRHLIPLGDPSSSRVVVGHNIGYDRARIKEEYSLAQSNTYFMDTMSLHVAVNGMCTRQRPTWMKHNKARDMRDNIANSKEGADLHGLLQSENFEDEEEHLWIGRSSVNSLRDVAKFHCGVTIDKSRREDFGELDRQGILGKYDELLDYCAADVHITHRVYQKVFPAFMETCSHPVSFAALRHLSAEILPVNETWEQYLDSAETTYVKSLEAVQERLVNLAERALELKDNPAKIEADPWLSQLDWSGQEVKMTKAGPGKPARPVKRQKMPGMPMWYKDLFPVKDGPINLTVRTRTAPILLRMTWDGHPLVWSDKHGFTFKVPVDEAAVYEDRAVSSCDMAEDKSSILRSDTQHRYFKLPHKDGPLARCASPLAKGYLAHFERGTLRSEFPYAKEALEMNASCSYWISARDRIRSQMVVYEEDLQEKPSSRKKKHRTGYILPQIIPMGTITRRSVENTWLTASNAKKNRVGSELKSMIKAPPGHVFVGADVDSEELWIAALMGDAQFKQHGGNALGFMTLEGTKAAGTDLHSRTAGILGISRNDAKVFNYGRMYGAGLNFASGLLKQFNADLTPTEVSATASRLYAETKGQKTLRKALSKRGFWRNGTESLVFNALEDFAEQDRPRTPVLGAGITEALLRRFVSKGEFMTSRVNWAIQSSGVDYLHLLIVSMDYLIKRYNIPARLAITVHDEIRYMVAEPHKYRAAMALQVANVWTRAMFAEQVGIHDLPQCCAYFSGVDIDHVLRKEVDMDCVTPSHTTPIPHGESLDIIQLLAKGEEARLDPAIVPATGSIDLAKHTYTPREPVIAPLLRETSVEYLRAQLADDAELKSILADLRKKASGPTSTGSREPKAPRYPKLRKMSIPKKWQPQGVTLPEMPLWAEQQQFPQRSRFGAGLGYTGTGQAARPGAGRDVGV